MKRILVPTDLSQEAYHALHLACQMAEKAHAELRLLHIVEHPKRVLLNTSGQIDLDEPEENTFIKELIVGTKGQMEQMAKRYQNIPIKIDVHIGDANTSVSQNIVTGDQDLIVMGTQGGYQKGVGSNTVKVVREASCPVITVKRRVYMSDLREIVFASNLQEEEPHVIEGLNELQQILDARIHILKVITANDLPATEADKELMNNFIRKYRLRNCDQSFIHAATEEEGVIKFTSNRPNSIIALGTHGRKGLAHIISGSVAEDLAHHASAPVWTSHIKKA